VSVIHVVAWAFKEATSATDREAVNGGLAKGKSIAQVRTFALSENRSPVRTDGFTYAYLATFDDQAGLAAFQRDPVHAPWGPRLVDAAEQLMVLDLECRTEDAPRRNWRGLRHVVTWTFKEGTTADEEGAVVAGLYSARVVKPTRSLAVGRSLGLSQRSFGRTHLQVTTYDDDAGLEEFRADTALHAPSGKRLQAHAAATTVIDVVD
jgi:hypothetical protein